MDLYTYPPGVALAAARIADLHRQADQQRLASRLPDRTRGWHRDRASVSRRRPDRHGQAAARTVSGRGRATTEAAMLIQHRHTPEEFDPGHCRACARQTGLLDHYNRVQREETRLRQARMWAHAARRYALWALGSSGAAILLAAVALLTR
jgi:hypothetical protein